MSRACWCPRWDLTSLRQALVGETRTQREAEGSECDVTFHKQGRFIDYLVAHRRTGGDGGLSCKAGSAAWARVIFHCLPGWTALLMASRSNWPGTGLRK